MTSYGTREGGAEWIMGAMTRNPEGLLLLAAGCALLMRSGRGKSPRRDYTEAFPTSRSGRQNGGHGENSMPGGRVAEAARRAGEYVSEATDRVSETARSYASAAAEYADETSRLAAERTRRVADQALDKADYVVREQPWAVALAGVVAGVAIAAAFPPTRIEKRTLGGVGERLRSAVGSAGEQLKQAGMQAGERLSEVAEERGLTSEGLKEAARQVGESFSSALTGEQPSSGQAAQKTRPGAHAGSQTEVPRVQSGTGRQHSNKGSGSTGRSPGTTPSGGRR